LQTHSAHFYAPLTAIHPSAIPFTHSAKTAHTFAAGYSWQKM